jgi:hypothetical protein
MRLGVLTGLVVSLTFTTVTAWGQGPRLEWQPEALSWHKACAFAPRGPEADAPLHRFVTLRAQLRAFAPEDASLYAVFVHDRKDLTPIEREIAKHAQVLTEHDGLNAQWVPLDANGEITLQVDEADRAGKNWVAVVNKKGEVLGVHPLWATDDVADQQPATPKNPG